MSEKELTLRSARIIKGMSQKELATCLKVHPQTISMWEKEPKKIPIGKAEQMSIILDVPLEIFLNV